MARGTLDDSAHNKVQTYLPYIDGLRGLSVLAILLFHLDITYFRGGFVGVDIFFVISGFLITKIITREIQASHFSFATFYARRIKRTFPALFAMMFASSLGAIVFLGRAEFYEFFKALRAASWDVSNIYYSHATDYFAIGNDNSPLLHTWSLGIEEQFYLIWPLLLIGIHRFWGLNRSLIVLATLLTASLAVSEYLVHTDALQAFYLLQSRAWELSLGGVVAMDTIPAIKRQRGIELYSALGLVMIGIALSFSETDFPGLKALVPCLGAALIIYTARQGTGLVHRMLSLPLIAFIGLISYSLYLWHWPMIAFYKSYFGSGLPTHVKLAIGVASFGLAYLSYRWIEQPTRNMKVLPAAVISCGVIAIAVFIVGGNILKHADSAGWRMNYSVDEAAGQPNDLYKTCAVEGGAYDRRHCIIGPNKDRYEVILVGDSFAANYIPTVLAWAQGRGLTVRIFLRGACQTFVEREEPVFRQGKRDSYCMDLTKAFYKTLDEDTSIRYIFLGLMLAHDNGDLRKSLERIDGYHKRPYYLGDVASFPDNPHECQVKKNLLLTRWFPRSHKDCLAFDQEYAGKQIGESHATLLPLLKEMKIAYFDPLPFMKTPFDKQGHFLYWDNGHLNQYGGLYLVPYLTAFMDKQLEQ
jgi:peptidoglycan/LPS O-acetylase OafA/YrhL